MNAPVSRETLFCTCIWLWLWLFNLHLELATTHAAFGCLWLPAADCRLLLTQFPFINSKQVAQVLTAAFGLQSASESNFFIFGKSSSKRRAHKTCHLPRPPLSVNQSVVKFNWALRNLFFLIACLALLLSDKTFINAAWCPLPAACCLHLLLVNCPVEAQTARPPLDSHAHGMQCT